MRMWLRRCLPVVVVLAVITGGMSAPASAQFDPAPSCPDRFSSRWGLTESPTRAWVARAWLAKLGTEVGAANAAAVPADIDDQTMVNVCTQNAPARSRPTVGLGSAKAFADAQIIVTFLDRPSKRVARFVSREVHVFLPPALGARMTPNDAALGFPPTLVWGIGKEAPAYWSAVTDRQWDVAKGRATMTIVGDRPGQPGLNRRDSFLWVDDCGTVTGYIDFGDKTVWTIQTAASSNCATEPTVRKPLGANTSFTRGAKPGTWILKGGGSALPVREKADVPTGTWKAATWEQDGATRAGIGEVTFERGRLRYSDGCNSRTSIFVVGPTIALAATITTAKACLPGSFEQTDVARLVDARGVIAYKRVDATTIVLTSESVRLTLRSA